jgi:hypothetical protein
MNRGQFTNLVLPAAATIVAWAIGAYLTPQGLSPHAQPIVLKSDIVVGDPKFGPPQTPGSVPGRIEAGSPCELNWVKGSYANVSCSFIVHRQYVEK